MNFKVLYLINENFMMTFFTVDKDMTEVKYISSTGLRNLIVYKYIPFFYFILTNALIFRYILGSICGFIIIISNVIKVGKYVFSKLLGHCIKLYICQMSISWWRSLLWIKMTVVKFISSTGLKSKFIEYYSLVLFVFLKICSYLQIHAWFYMRWLQ